MLENITTGQTGEPLRIVICGKPGVGKTTFAANAPGALIADCERGSGQIDCARIDIGTTKHMKDLTDDLIGQKAKTYQTLVIDSIDWYQNRIFQEIATEEGVGSLASIPYGAGFPPAVNKFAKFLTINCEALRKAGMNVIFVAHMAPLMVNDNPKLEPHQRHSLKLYPGSASNPGGTAALVREWADYILYAAHDSEIKEVGDKFNKRNVPITSGERVLYTQGSETYEAKSRRPIAKELPLDWDAFWNAHSKAKTKKAKEAAK